MTFTRRTLLMGSLALGLFAGLAPGCASRRGHGDAGPSDAGAVDAGPPAPPELRFTLRLEDGDGGTQEGTFRVGEPLFVAPAQQLHVQATRLLRNYRIRLFDEADRALESDDESHDAPGGTQYAIGLKAPLKPGRKYAFVVDAQSGAMLSDAQGNAITEQRFELQTTGDRVKDKPAAKGPTSKRRHRRHR